MVPRLLSVVNILSHLATTHQADLQTAVRSVLAIIQPHHHPLPTHIASTPYLLSLSSLSHGLKISLTSQHGGEHCQDIQSCEKILPQLCKQSTVRQKQVRLIASSSSLSFSHFSGTSKTLTNSEGGESKTRNELDQS